MLRDLIAPKYSCSQIEIYISLDCALNACPFHDRFHGTFAIKAIYSPEPLCPEALVLFNMLCAQHVDIGASSVIDECPGDRNPLCRRWVLGLLFNCLCSFQKEKSTSTTKSPATSKSLPSRKVERVIQKKSKAMMMMIYLLMHLLQWVSVSMQQSLTVNFSLLPTSISS